MPTCVTTSLSVPLTDLSYQADGKRNSATCDDVIYQILFMYKVNVGPNIRRNKAKSESFTNISTDMGLWQYAAGIPPILIFILMIDGVQT